MRFSSLLLLAAAAITTTAPILRPLSNETHLRVPTAEAVAEAVQDLDETENEERRRIKIINPANLTRPAPGYGHILHKNAFANQTTHHRVLNISTTENHPTKVHHANQTVHHSIDKNTSMENYVRKLYLNRLLDKNTFTNQTTNHKVLNISTTEDHPTKIHHTNQTANYPVFNITSFESQIRNLYLDRLLHKDVVEFHRPSAKHEYKSFYGNQTIQHWALSVSSTDSSHGNQTTTKHWAFNTKSSDKSHMFEVYLDILNKSVIELHSLLAKGENKSSHANQTLQHLALSVKSTDSSHGNQTAKHWAFDTISDESYFIKLYRDTLNKGVVELQRPSAVNANSTTKKHPPPHPTHLLGKGDVELHHSLPKYDNEGSHANQTTNHWVVNPNSTKKHLYPNALGDGIAELHHRSTEYGDEDVRVFVDVPTHHDFPPVPEKPKGFKHPPPGSEADLFGVTGERSCERVALSKVHELSGEMGQTAFGFGDESFNDMAFKFTEAFDECWRITNRIAPAPAPAPAPPQSSTVGDTTIVLAGERKHSFSH